MSECLQSLVSLQTPPVVLSYCSFLFWQLCVHVTLRFTGWGVTNFRVCTFLYTYNSPHIFALNTSQTMTKSLSIKKQPYIPALTSEGLQSRKTTEWLLNEKAYKHKILITSHLVWVQFLGLCVALENKVFIVYFQCTQHTHPSCLNKTVCCLT